MVDLLEKVSTLINRTLINIEVSKIVRSLIIDGIIKGVSSVLSFIPELTILFLCISILETTGYMSRIAILLDQFFRKLGLSGKSLIPFIVGLGCSVPGIMSSRIIEKEEERKMTSILTPFVPCSAKLPIIVFFTSRFFQKNAGIVSASFYFFSVIVIIISSLMMKKLIYRNTSNTYISELPKYQLPNFKYVLRDVKDKVLSFVKRAGSVILLCSIVLWVLLSFSFKFQYGVSLEESMLAQIGDKISFLFYPILGVKSWEATVSAIQGLLAKEQVVSSMSIIGGFSKDGAFSFFTKASAYAFVVFNLFSAPCIGAIGAMKKELGGTFKVIKATAYQTSIAWILAALVYQVGHRWELGVLKPIDIFIIIGIMFLSIFLMKKMKKVRCTRDCRRCSMSCKYEQIVKR